MTPGALGFLLVSWGVVLGVAGWAFGRILRSPRGRADGGTVPPSPH